jgi:hypothetical protein
VGPPGYPHAVEPPDATTRARRAADAERATADGWTLTLEHGLAKAAIKRGAKWGEPGRLGPFTDESLAALRDWVLDHPALFGLDGAAPVFATWTEHPRGLRGSLCQQSGGRSVACIHLSWSGPGYSNGMYYDEQITIAGHLHPSLPPLPPELDDATLAGAAFDAEAPWVFRDAIVAGDFRQIDGVSEHRSARGTRIQHISIVRRLWRTRIGDRLVLRMIATVSSRISGRERYFDAVTGEQLDAGDLRSW